MDSGVREVGSGDSQVDGGFRTEGPVAAEEIAGAEDITDAVAIASVGLTFRRLLYYNCYA